MSRHRAHAARSAARPARRHATNHAGHRRHGRYGNPADLAHMIARQETPERAGWQRPDRVLRTLGVRSGQVVADIGAGPGYFTRRLARAVGPRGHVFAVDPEPEVLDVLRERLSRARARNVTPVLGRGDDPLLPAGRCDLALMVNVYHHLADGPAFLRRVREALARGGRLAVVEFARRETPVGPPVDHRVARETLLRDARRAGLVPVAEHAFLPHQYFLVFRARGR